MLKEETLRYPHIKNTFEIDFLKNIYIPYKNQFLLRPLNHLYLH